MSIRLHSMEGRGAFTAERNSLEAERDPGLKAEGLYHLARRMEARGEPAAAAELYRGLEATPAAERAAARLRVLAGEGSFGERAEFLLGRFAQEATEPSTLFAMGTAGALFKVTRLLAISRLTAAPASWLTRGWGARSLASLAGFAVEAPAFPLAGRAASAALGQNLDWSARALSHDLASSVLVLGGMRLGGLVSSSAARSLGGTGLSPFSQGFFRQSGMLGGILLGHRFEELAGLRAPTSASATLIDSLALLLQFNVAGRLTQAAFGEGFRRWENRMEWQTRRLGSAVPQARLPAYPPMFPGSVPAFAMAALGGRQGGREGIGPTILMTKGSGTGGRPSGWPTPVRVSLLQLRHPNLKWAQGHLAYLETVLAAGGKDMGGRDFLELYNRLFRELNVQKNEELALEIGNVLTNVLAQMPLNRPGPRLLFNDMIHVDRFGKKSLGESLNALMENPSLGSAHRRRILRMVEAIFRDKVYELYEEATGLLASYTHRLSGEGRPFHRALNAALAFFNGNATWFHRLGGIELAKVAVMDTHLSRRHLDHILALLRNGFRDTSLTSQQRVEAMGALESIVQHPNLPRSVREELGNRLPLWRGEFLYDNIVRTRRGRGEWVHFAEMAYLLTQEYTGAAERGDFSRALRRLIFEARFGTPGYKIMVSDALRYLEDPRLTPDSRQTFLLQILKAAGDLNRVVAEKLENSETRETVTYVEDPDFVVDLTQLKHLVAIIRDLPREESLNLAQHLSAELLQRDGQRAYRASILLETLAVTLYPNQELIQSLSAAAEQSPNLQAREVAQQALLYWQSLN